MIYLRKVLSVSKAYVIQIISMGFCFLFCNVAVAHDFYADELEAVVAQTEYYTGTHPQEIHYIDSVAAGTPTHVKVSSVCVVHNADNVAKNSIFFQDDQGHTIFSLVGCQFKSGANAYAESHQEMIVPIPERTYTISLLATLSGSPAPENNNLEGVQSSNLSKITATLFGALVPLTGNLSPTAVKDTSYTAVSGVGKTFYPLNNDSDPDGDTLIITRVWQEEPQNSVVVDSDTSFVFTPHIDFTGIDYMYYEITDGNGGYSTGSIQINVFAP
ncbi:MAG: Ig-like domain-containing protein [Cellvibrionaceae bacterium]